MPGQILKFEELSSPSLAELDTQKTAFFIPVSPLEGHGPHLPLGVDFFDAIHFAEVAARVAVERRPDFDAVILPPLPLGTQLYKQPGSIRVGSATMYETVLGFGRSLACFGFRFIFVLSGHGSPKDIVAVEAACRKVSRKFGVEMHNLSGALAVRFLKGEYTQRISDLLDLHLSAEEKKLLEGDTHAGWWETSMMLYLRPGLVSEQYKELPCTSREKKPSGADPGYYGAPSKASREFAEASLKVLTEEVGALIESSLAGNDIVSEVTSPFYKFLPLRPYFKRNLILAGIAFSVIAITVAFLVS